MRRTKQEAAVTRESLLKASLTVFSQKGYASATLEDVARQAGVTRGAIYWHFGSKAELYGALVGEYSSRSGQIVQHAASEGGSLLDILRRVFVRLLEAVEDDPALRAVMEISLFKTERVPELAEIYNGQAAGSHVLLEGIAQVMRQGVAAGDLRADLDPLDMARAFLGFQQGMIYLWVLAPETFSLKGSAPALAEIFFKGIVHS
jgi:TetR/AcrR family acrAB operon transcriptional repressor